MFRGKLLAGIVAAVALAAAVPANAVPVKLELALLVDVSGSVDGTEYTLQKTGYVNAFKDAGIQTAIAGAAGGIAVTYIEWSGAGQQSTLVGWTHLTDATSADAFADAIDASVRAFSGLTAPGNAIAYAAPLFDNNGFEGDRLLIDISGDGSQNDGIDTSDARDDALLNDGITAINGLPILGSEANLDTWYAANIQGGTGSFTTVAASFAAFEGAVISKIGREVTGSVPEPGTLALFGFSLLGLAGMRKRRKV